MSAPQTQLVGIDILDAAELSEICSYLGAWIQDAPDEVTASLHAFGGQGARHRLTEALGHYADLLGRLVPSGSPQLPHGAAPLGPGEALGLAELLSDLAEGGWPADPDHALAVEDDCRHWALRLVATAGIGGGRSPRATWCGV